MILSKILRAFCWLLAAALAAGSAVFAIIGSNL